MHTALLNFLLPVDEISSKALLVLWLCLLLKMEVGVFFSLGRWVMYLIQLNKSHDYCNIYASVQPLSPSSLKQY